MLAEQHSSLSSLETNRTFLKRFFTLHRRVVDTEISPDHFADWGSYTRYLRTLLPSQEGERLHIADRYNWNAEIARARALRSSVGAYGIDAYSFDQQKEFRKGIEMLYREFCLAERDYTYDRMVVRKKFGTDYLYKIVAYDVSDTRHRHESVDQAFVREGLIGMLSRGVEHSSIPSRDRAYKNGIVESYKGWIGDFYDPTSEGRVRVHLSPPPPDASTVAREGYGTHSFINFNITHHLDADRLQIRAVNLRTELSLEQQLVMIQKLGESDSQEKASALLTRIRRGDMIALEEVLSLSFCLSEKCDISALKQFIETSYDAMLSDAHSNVRHTVESDREKNYLAMLLSHEDISSIKAELESIQKNYFTALVSGASVSELRTIVDYLEYRANSLYAKYKMRADKKSGVKGKNYSQYYDQATQFNVQGNDACRTQTVSVESAPSIEVLPNEAYVLINGERKDNPLILCPDCGREFRLYVENRQNLVCPNEACEYDPCTKTSKLRKNAVPTLQTVSSLTPRIASVARPVRASFRQDSSPAFIQMSELLLREQTQRNFKYDPENNAYFTLLLGAGRYYISASEYRRRVDVKLVA